jgi:hypothetical protein
MEEIWKEVDGFDNYEVSNQGNVRNIKTGRILKPGLDNYGYQLVVLSSNKKTHTKKVHRLVLLSFARNTENKATVNHINGIKTDNRIENLEWSTNSENCLHAFSELNRTPSRAMLGKFGKNHNNSKPIIQYKDGIEVGRYEGQMDAFRKTGISFKHISEACHGKIKSSGGFQWSFENKITV